MIGFFIAMLSGALMSVQGVFNTKLTESTSLWVANAFVQFTAFLLCIAAWLVTDRSSMRSLFNVEPKYFLLGGVMGAFITLTVIKSMDSLGPAKAVMLIVIAQLIVAYLIVWGREAALCLEKGNRSVGGNRRLYCIQMGLANNVKCKK